MINYSIIQKSQLEGANRLDSEYYQPEYLYLKNKIVSFQSQPLVNYLEYLTDGAHKTPVYQETGIAFLSSGLIFENYIDFENAKFISEREDSVLKHCKPKLNDVLISKSGKIGTATVFNKPINCNLFEGVALLRTTKINPYFLTVFLNSVFGQKQIERLVIGISQPHLHLEQIEKIIIPFAPDSMQNKIENIYRQSQSFLDKSKSLYKQAEDMLLEELGLTDFEIPQDLTYVVNYSEVKNANRMDPDFFQPKFENLIKHISEHNPSKLGEIVSMKKGIEVGSEQYQEEGKLFIRVSSLSRNGIEEKDQKYLSEDLYKRLKKDYEPKFGEILLTKDATPGIAYVLKENVEGIISGGILKLSLNADIEPEFLALCINSLIGKMQAERDAGGSIIKHWRPEQIKNILIPVLYKETQQKIADLVKKSHEARKKSKELLEQAKRKVEEMVEKGA